MAAILIGTATKAECLAKANRLLALGIKSESEEKSRGLIDKSIELAAKWENAGLDGRE